LRRLDGEYDLNFLAEELDGTGYVVKAMRPGCEEWLVRMQIEALDHIASVAPDLPIPGVIAAQSGAKFLRLPDEAGAERLVWVIERLPGKCYAQSYPKSERLLRLEKFLLRRGKFSPLAAKNDRAAF
jgi:Ser/Thr protein kinase RdoA (MazF antagonist)